MSSTISHLASPDAPADNCHAHNVSASNFLHTSFGDSIERYRAGTCRDRIVHDLILVDADRLGRDLTFLDIGCGMGFDGDVPLQKSLARRAGKYIGIEPDASISPGRHITDLRRCRFEQAELPHRSVHIAFAIMVVEHLNDPQPFWDKLLHVLVPGGVFWALTVDARHWFRWASTWSERLMLKELYLFWLLGRRGIQRYENYPVYYRCNTPDRMKYYAKQFSAIEYLSLCRVGQCDNLVPCFFRPLSRALESKSINRGAPGALLMIRAAK